MINKNNIEQVDHPQTGFTTTDQAFDLMFKVFKAGR
jgi:hypothetical protein